MTYTPINPPRYESSQPRPVYPPHLTGRAGYPAGQSAFPPADPGQPTMLPGYLAAQASHEEPQPSYGAAQPGSYGQPAHPQPPAPSYGQPGYGRYPQPAYQQQPTYTQPTYEQPTYQQPRHPQQVTDLSTHEQAYAAYHQGQAAQQYAATAAAAPARRPRVLTVAVWSGVAAAGLTIASQVLALTTGRAAIESAIAKELPAGSEQFAALISAAVDEAYATIRTRAMLAIGLAVVVAVLVALCLRAGLAARIMAVTAMAATGLLLMVCLIDVYPSTARLVGLPALLLFPVTAALLFMPAVGRYRTSRSRRVQVGAPLGAVRG